MAHPFPYHRINCIALVQICPTLRIEAHKVTNCAPVSSICFSRRVEQFARPSSVSAHVLCAHQKDEKETKQQIRVISRVIHLNCVVALDSTSSSPVMLRILIYLLILSSLSYHTSPLLLQQRHHPLKIARRNRAFNRQDGILHDLRLVQSYACFCHLRLCFPFPHLRHIPILGSDDQISRLSTQRLPMRWGPSMFLPQNLIYKQLTGYQIFSLASTLISVHCMLVC